MKWLLLDNYDSFTFNLYQLIAEISGATPLVVRNDALSWEEFRGLQADVVVISPGPGHPERERDFGICRQVIERADVPILGVCLGHQGIAAVCGGKVGLAPEPVHGRTCNVYHTGAEIFAGLPQGFNAVRYHSLMVSRPLPGELEEIAWTSDGIVMGLRHRRRPLWGVQFHPESICTEHGRMLLRNFQEFAWRRGVAARGGARLEAQPTPEPAVEVSSHPWRLWSRRLEALPDPESVFRNLYQHDPAAFWLDSSQADGGLARFSFMGGVRGARAAIIRYFQEAGRVCIESRDHIVEASGPLFQFLRSWIAQRACASGDLPFDFAGGLVGYFGYEMKAECGARRSHRSEVPDAVLIFADRLIAFDHVARATYLVCVGPPEARDDAELWFEQTTRALRDPAPAGTTHLTPKERLVFRPELSRQRYLQSIARCQQHIRAGESYEICLTTQLKAVTAIEPFRYYTVLRRLNPAPYAAFLRLPELAVASSSPERFLKVRPDGSVESKPIKGTLRRGATVAEDGRLREQLRTDPKSRSENLMIVDLLRNDLGSVCAIGSVHVPKLMAVESYATVHQLVSTIAGRLRPGVTAVDCLQCVFPGGSMTGAPKLRTMEHIDELEPGPRGIYSGGLGYLSLNGAADLSIVIRTAVFRNGVVSIGTGGAVVALSEEAAEYEEILLKARALVDAFRQVGGEAEIEFARDLTRLTA